MVYQCPSRVAFKTWIGRTLKFWTLNQNTIKELISEMIHIKEQKNGLNLSRNMELLDESHFNILDILTDLPRTHKHSIYLLFLICSCLCNAHLRFERQVRWTLIHHSLVIEVLIGYILALL